MKLKSILSLTLAAAFLAGCTSLQLRVVDGKEREVFVSVMGIYSKNGATKDDFNVAFEPCLKAAVEENRGKHLDRFIPYNYPARARHNDAMIESAEPCVQAAGYELVERSKSHSSMPGKL
jgi:hypothetical protein